MAVDLLRPGLKLVFCGYNPSLTSGRSGHHYWVVTSYSISNQTQAPLFLSTIGKPHPPCRPPGRGRGSESASKPEPGSHTLPRTEPAETATESEIWSFGKSPACRMLLVTSSLTTSRTSSSFAGGNRSLSPSRVWRAVVMTSGSGANLRFTSASIARLTPKVVVSAKSRVPVSTGRYTPPRCCKRQICLAPHFPTHPPHFLRTSDARLAALMARKSA